MAAMVLFAGIAQAGTVTSDGVVLSYQAAPGETNHVSLIRESDGMRVIDTGAPVTASTGCDSVTASEAFCADDQPSALMLEIGAGDQDDYVDLQAARVDNLSTLSGGAGTDTLIGTPRAVNRYEGGPGPDTFIGRGTVDYSSRTAPVRVTVGDGLANDGEAGEGDTVPDEITNIWGGEASDVIKVLDSPTVGRTALSGGGGDDRLIARNPRGAILLGGAGEDELRVHGIDGIAKGGGGKDLVVSGRDAQYLWGGPGDDVLVGRAGDDVLIGSGENDRLEGGPGRDSMSGGLGGDSIFANDGTRDVVNGGKGTDSARVDKGLDRVLRVEGLL